LICPIITKGIEEILNISIYLNNSFLSGIISNTISYIDIRFLKLFPDNAEVQQNAQLKLYQNSTDYILPSNYNTSTYSLTSSDFPQNLACSVTQSKLSCAKVSVTIGTLYDIF